MSGSSKSSVQSTPRPTNVFYVWYTELCRRLNTTPVPAVKPARPKSSTVLDFVGDRIKAEEWFPVLNALEKDASLHVIAVRSRVECQFLYDVDTEERVRRMKRRYGFLWTSYILRRLIRSVSCVLKSSRVLCSLELDGLPVSGEYLEPLLEHLKINRTLKMLSLQRCPIKDEGCQQLCFALRYTPNIELINLTACELTSRAAECVAKLIKFQQINRYSESWHNSLRYTDPEVNAMRGLKRITLNKNPGIGDEGLAFILDELDDDLWIKALDMQKCGITDKIAQRLLDVVDYSRSLQVADFRHNEFLSTVTVERVLEILSQKQDTEYDTEYRWCLTASTFQQDDDVSRSGFSSVVQKSKSAPFKQIGTSLVSENLRRTKTLASVSRSVQNRSEISSITQARKKIQNLNEKLQKEIIKRQETEQVNLTLKNKLEEIKKASTIKIPEESKEKFAKCIEIIEALEVDNEEITSMPIKEVFKKKNGVTHKKNVKHVARKLKSVKKEMDKAEKNTDEKIDQLLDSLLCKNTSMEGNINTKNPNGKVVNEQPNGVKKGVKKKSIKFSPAKSKQAENVFKNFLYKDELTDDGSEDEHAMLSNYYNLDNATQNKMAAFLDTTNEETLDEMSASNISLKRFMEELQNDNNNVGLNLNELIRPDSSSSSRTRTFMPKIIPVKVR